MGLSHLLTNMQLASWENDRAGINQAAWPSSPCVSPLFQKVSSPRVGVSFVLFAGIGHLAGPQSVFVE